MQKRGERGERRGTGVVLDPFGDDAQLKGFGNRDDRAHEPESFGVFAQAADEALVDLEFMHREIVEVGKRRIAGTEVVDRPLHRVFAGEGAHLRDGLFRRADQDVFGDFERQAAARPSAFGKRRNQLRREIA